MRAACDDSFFPLVSEIQLFLKKLISEFLDLVQKESPTHPPRAVLMNPRTSFWGWGSKLVERCVEAAADGSFSLLIQAQPQARVAMIGPVDKWRGRLRVAVRAPASDGDANAALIAAVATALGVASSSIRIESGGKNRLKRLRVQGIDIDSAVTILNRIIEEANRYE